MSWWTITILAVLLVGVTIYLVWQLGARAQRNPYVSGREAVIGHVGEAKTDLNPNGQVFIEGALWSAVSEHGKIPRGEKIVAIGMTGLRLVVRKEEE